MLPSLLLGIGVDMQEVKGCGRLVTKCDPSILLYCPAKSHSSMRTHLHSTTNTRPTINKCLGNCLVRPTLADKRFTRVLDPPPTSRNLPHFPLVPTYSIQLSKESTMVSPYVYTTLSLHHYSSQLRFLFLAFLALLPAFLWGSMAPLTSLKNWSPFKIDALGLITLLGADVIRKALGRLVYSPFEYFPLLAGHIFADNSVAEPIPGFVLYNITESMKAVDLSAWFTRWLLCQYLTYSNTRLEIRSAPRPEGWTSETCLAVIGAVSLNAFLFIWPMLMGD
jgi:hypothetical protein